MSYKVIGKVEKFLDVRSGTSKSGKDWKSQSFVLKTDDEYNNLYCFEVFGEEKVENLTKYNKVGDVVEVEFNVSTNEYQGKYYTKTQAWRITGQKAVEEVASVPDESEDDLPF